MAVKLIVALSLIVVIAALYADGWNVKRQASERSLVSQGSDNPQPAVDGDVVQACSRDSIQMFQLLVSLIDIIFDLWRDLHYNVNQSDGSDGSYDWYRPNKLQEYKKLQQIKNKILENWRTCARL